MLATKPGIDGEIKAKGELYLYPSFWEKVQESAADIFIQRAVEALKPLPELEWYSIRDYPLSEARIEFRIDDFPAGGGDVLLILVRTGTASVKFDSPNADSYDLATYRKMRHSYESVYLTNKAQAGKTLRLLFGKGDWDLEQTTPTVDLEGLLQQENLAQITDPEKLADSIIRAAKIATHAVEAEKIAENAITETKIAPDSIATPHLKANIVTGDKIAAGTITGNLIAANVIATYHLLAACITTGKIATGAITADKIAALTITAGKIAAGAITAEKIAADSITADKYHELRNTYVFSDQDSLDATYPLEMLFEIISEMTAIQNIKLSFRIRNFRAYATGVPAGGGHTTPSGGGHTSSSGGGQTSSSTGTPSGGGHTTPSGGGHTTPSGGGSTSGPHDAVAHTHTITQQSRASENVLVCDGRPWHDHDYYGHPNDTGGTKANTMHTHSTPNHTHQVSNHQHQVSNHTHPQHSHTVSNHTHAVYSHQHTVSNHEHALSFGIHEEDEEAPTINVYIDNGAGYEEDPIGTYTEDQLDIDITDHISGAGFKQVKFTSDKRTRIATHVLCKVDLTA